MLILTRRVAEVLYVGENVTVTVLAIKGNQVRIGVTAPSSVSVDREEVRARKALADPAGPRSSRNGEGQHSP
jgi:carbon storage regulator CsrA